LILSSSTAGNNGYIWVGMQFGQDEDGQSIFEHDVPADTRVKIARVANAITALAAHSLSVFDTS
jgi:hypothetical protein